MNDSQAAAALHPIGEPLMIVAGPGSGKTHTMMGRPVSHLL